jgi:heme/copper-type cytochrome/quinol oxidase subunit 3
LKLYRRLTVSESEVAIHGHGPVGHGALMEASPYAIPSRKLTMWLFIISDAVTFGAFLFAYG